MNTNGIIGGASYDANDSVGLDYPVGSGFSHLSAAGPLVGARVEEGGRITTRVSAAFVHSLTVNRSSEMLGFQEQGDSIWNAGALETGLPNRRGFDDDGDGRIDEDDLDGTDNDGDWLLNRDDLNFNGKPDHGEPNVDEDYGAVSEHDIYYGYRDSFTTYQVPGHVPLNIKVWQRAYSWEKQVKEPIIPIEYHFINNGERILDSVYVGLLVEPGVGEARFLNTHSEAGYISQVRTAYATNPDLPAATPFGVTLLGMSKPSGELRITYKTFDTRSVGPSGDLEAYQVMSSGVIDQVQSRAITFLLAVGPYVHMGPGDTLMLTVAFIGGLHLDVGPGNLRNHAAKAIELYNRNYYPPAAPPSPPLRITPVKNGLKLDWTWQPGDPKFDPLETWDDSNKIVKTVADTSWRRRNPPPGKSTGGRIFEAFDLWRSDYPLFQENTFSLLKRFDVADELDFEGQAGIQFSYLDTTLVRGRTYRYTVTSRAIPDYVFIDFPTTSGVIKTDTVLSEPVESLLFENVVKYQMPFFPSATLGEVKVVPNPYRTDADYTYQGGGWEGLGYQWNETKRLVWFIHLPPKCTIRIFSLVGEVIKVIGHDDDERQARGLAVGQEEFTLLSESNRALASGIYVYLVESALGTQTGKFVVIR